MYNMEQSAKLSYYEKRLSLLLFLATIPNAFVTLQMLILHFTPEHRCYIELQGNSTIQHLAGSENVSGVTFDERILDLVIPWESTGEGKQYRSKCLQFDPPFNSSEENRSKIACDTMFYEGSSVSAVTELDLVCERAWIRPLLSSLLFVGMIIGSIPSGYLADRFGRRPVFLLATACQFITVTLLSFAPDVCSYAVLFTLCGLVNMVNYGVASVIGSEMTTQKYRLWMYFSLLMGYSVGYLMMSPLTYLFPNWRWFLRFSGLIGLLYIPYYWLIDETPYWLFSSGKAEDAKAVLRKIAKLNGLSYKTDDFFKLEKEEALRPLSTIQTLVSVGKERILLLWFAITALMWFTLGMTYYVLAYGTNNLSGNRFVNIFLSGLVDVCGGLLFLLCERKMGRVLTYILPTTLLGLSLILTCVVPESQVAFLISLNLIGKLTVAASFAIVYVHVMEIFPTRTRQTVLFVASSVARVGGILSPFLLYVGEDGNNVVSTLVVACVILLSAFGCAFLPETKNASLPKTTQEAKALPRKRWCAFRPESAGKNHSIVPPSVELQPLGGATAH